MKRMKGCAVLALALLTLTAALTACGTKPAEEPKQLDLETVYQSLMDAQSEPEDMVLLPESDETLLESFYPGLKDVRCSQRLVYFAPVSGFACEVVMVEVEDEADVRTVQDIFQARIDAGAADTIYPATADAWARLAQVQSDGKYVAMLALPESAFGPENVFSDPAGWQVPEKQDTPDEPGVPGAPDAQADPEPVGDPKAPELPAVPSAA